MILKIRTCTHSTSKYGNSLRTITNRSFQESCYYMRTQERRLLVGDPLSDEFKFDDSDRLNRLDNPIITKREHSLCTESFILLFSPSRWVELKKPPKKTTRVTNTHFSRYGFVELHSMYIQIINFIIVLVMEMNGRFFFCSAGAHQKLETMIRSIIACSCYSQQMTMPLREYVLCGWRYTQRPTVSLEKTWTFQGEEFYLYELCSLWSYNLSASENRLHCWIFSRTLSLDRMLCVATAPIPYSRYGSNEVYED